MTRPADLLLNGRFLSRPMTGVDRVATELTMALCQVLADQDHPRQLRLCLPKTGIHDAGSRPDEIMALQHVASAQSDGYLWEQITLQGVRRQDWLLSLCNMGPALRRNQVVIIHDAQVFTQPQTYSRLFRLAYKTLLPRLSRRARVVVTVSDFSRKELESHGIAPKGKAVVIPNGVDHITRVKTAADTLTRHGLTENGYFLVIGSLAPHKNLRMLIEATNKRRDMSRPLIVAGGGNARVFQDASLPGGDGTRFLGRVSDEELKALYGGATALLFPSRTEGFGLPSLEAMACGCPVVATTGGAVPEVCGTAALYADPDRPQEWTNAMDRLSDDAPLRATLSASGRQHASTFTWKRAAISLLAAIEAAEED